MTAPPVAQEAVGRQVMPSGKQPIRPFASAMTMLSLVGLTSALVLLGTSLSGNEVQLIGAPALVLVALSLFSGGLALRRWHLDSVTNHAFAARLSNFHAVMSQSNRLVLRRPNPCELFEGVCELCINAGQMDLVIVDMFDQGEIHRAAAKQTTGRGPSLSPELLVDGARLQALMMTLALHSGGCIVVNDASTDERLSDARPWCIANGLRSFAAVPLRRGDVLIGVLLLCCRKRSFFGGHILPLLSELGADLSFALDNDYRERQRRAALHSDHARKAAEDANRAKNEFLAQMSHELRTPLNAMLGFAQLLATDKGQALSPLQAERVRLITQAGWHLLGLVNDVMDISRIEARSFEVVNVEGNISPVLDEAVALTQPLARKHKVKLTERAVTTLGIGAVADPRRLLQVLLNLLSNSCKYNRPGGQVNIDVTRLEPEVVIDVVDNGVGMTADQLSHLFEPFNRLGNQCHAIEGSGIGLTLARQLVEMMNGRLEIESNRGSGTRARLILPSCDLVSITPCAQTNMVQSAPKRRVTAIVLNIEDDPVNRILVEQMLIRCEGVHLVNAENGKEGISMARNVQPDLVLLDMQLPDMSGFDVLRALRNDAQTGTMQVVAVSANALPEDVARATALGALDYWTKPLELKSFLAGVTSLLKVRDSTEHNGSSRTATPSPPLETA